MKNICDFLRKVPLIKDIELREKLEDFKNFIRIIRDYYDEFILSPPNNSPPDALPDDFLPIPAPSLLNFPPSQIFSKKDKSFNEIIYLNLYQMLPIPPNLANALKNKLPLIESPIKQ